MNNSLSSGLLHDDNDDFYSKATLESKRDIFRIAKPH